MIEGTVPYRKPNNILDNLAQQTKHDKGCTHNNTSPHIERNGFSNWTPLLTMTDLLMFILKWAACEKLVLLGRLLISQFEHAVYWFATDTWAMVQRKASLGCMCIHFNPHVLEWNRMKFSLISLQSTSTYMWIEMNTRASKQSLMWFGSGLCIPNLLHVYSRASRWSNRLSDALSFVVYLFPNRTLRWRWAP
jgi:hypothetical protein